MRASAGEASWLHTIVCATRERRDCLRALSSLAPPGAWLSAGFVRNAVFTELFGPPRVQLESDLDVIYFDAQQLDVAGQTDWAVWLVIGSVAVAVVTWSRIEGPAGI